MNNIKTTEIIDKNYLINMELRKQETFRVVGKDYNRVRATISRLYEKGYDFMFYSTENKTLVNIKRLG